MCSRGTQTGLKLAAASSGQELAAAGVRHSPEEVRRRFGHAAQPALGTGFQPRASDAEWLPSSGSAPPAFSGSHSPPA